MGILEDLKQRIEENTEDITYSEPIEEAYKIDSVNQKNIIIEQLKLEYNVICAEIDILLERLRHVEEKLNKRGEQAYGNKIYRAMER